MADGILIPWPTNQERKTLYRNRKHGKNFMAFKKVERPILTIGEKWSDGYLVTYPVSYRYNGGIVIGDKLYEGFTVPAPKIPEGYYIEGIGCGFQLNARPPYATVFIGRKDKKKFTKKELKEAIAERC